MWKFDRSWRPSLAKILLPLQDRASGEMAEWLKAHAWKACVRETVPWVRIPLSPPLIPDISYCDLETGPKIRLFSRVFRAGESRSLVKMSPRCGWRTHFSPNLSTARIGMVRNFLEKKGLMKVGVWISLAQPTCSKRRVLLGSRRVSS